MNKKVITIFLIVTISILLGIIAMDSNRTKNQKSQTEEVVKSENPIYYYGITCPNCTTVEKFIEENKISEKMVIVEKEVYENQENASELTAVAQQCGIKSNEIGVPLLFAEGKCYVGSVEVINYLKEKLDLNTSVTEPANE